MTNTEFEIVTLGDLADEVSVRVDNPSESEFERFVGLKHMDSGKLTISRWDSTESVTSTMKQFLAGDVLLARRNAHLRRASSVEFDGVCSGDAYVLREKPNNPAPGLLRYILNTKRFWDFAIANADGSMSTRAKWKHLKNYKFTITKSEDDYAKVIEILDTITNYNQLILELSESVQSCFNKISQMMFSKMFKNQDFAEIKSLEEIAAQIHHGPFGSNLKSMHYSDSGPRVIRLQNIGLRKLIDDDKAYISNDYYNSKIMAKFRLQEGDIVFAGLGDDSNPIGRCFIIEKHSLPAVQSSDAICIRIKDPVLRNFTMIYLNSNYCYQQISRVSQGSTRLRINGTNLKKLRIPLPDDMQKKKLMDFCLLFDKIHPMLKSNKFEQISCIDLIIGKITGGV